MKTWMKILMWLGLGGSVGFFAGYQVGQRAERQDIYNLGYDDGKKAAEAANADISEERMVAAINSYSGEDPQQLYAPEVLQSETVPPEEEDPPMVDEVPMIGDEDDVEIEELHPQHFVPELISDNEAFENSWNYRKVSLVYYEDDRILYNPSTRSVVEEPDAILGIGTLAGFHTSQESYGALFVKNDTLGVIFRIDRVDAAYNDPVSGANAPDYEDDDEEDFTRHDAE